MPAFGSLRPKFIRVAPWSLSIAALLLASCGGGSAGQGAAPPQMVTYETVAPRTVAVEFEYPGQASGSREVEIHARVDGIIDKRLFEEGSHVQAGQRLFQIAPAPYQAALAAAEASVVSAEANVKKAQRDYDRYQPLIEKQLISQADFDNSASALDVAKAALQAAQAERDTARINLGYTDVRAPISGLIGRALKVEGALADASSDSLLATMAQVDPIDVYFAVSDADHSSAQRDLASGSLVLPKGGYVVKLKTNEGQWLPQSGTLNFSDYKADANTGAYSTRARFANGRDEITPGQFLRVVLTGATRPDAIAVPQRAVLASATGKFVYVVGKGKDGKPAAEPRPVVPGEWVQLEGADPNGWVIKEGLKAGDEVIVDGTARIFYPFQAITPLTAEQAAAQAAQAAQAAAGAGAPAGK
ncbi:MAG: efflux RND transporter periplasmic adaptor subunit [Steroidobacteraceae bacterium]